MYCPHCMYHFDEPKDDTTSVCPSCGKELNEQNNAFQLPIGTMLAGRYYIGKSIGQGGFGITYIGLDIKLDLKVAVKEYFPQGLVARLSTYSNELTITAGDEQNVFEKQKQRFISEARILAEFEEDPNVVRVRDIVAENNTAYIVMEFIDGITLDEYRKQHGNLTFPEAFLLLKPVIESLGRIHSKGLIHRDISPANLMITNVDQHIKILDFGSASDFEPNEDISRSVILKPGYAPAEQYNRHGVQGPWSDVYALCATIYRMITGVVPENAFERLGMDALKRPSELGAVISPEAEAVLMCGMAVQPGQRISSMGDLLDAFESAAKKNVVKKAIPFYENANDTIPVNEDYDATMILPDSSSISSSEKQSSEGGYNTAGLKEESNRSNDRISDTPQKTSGGIRAMYLLAAAGIIFLIWFVVSAVLRKGSEPAAVPSATYTVSEEESKTAAGQELSEAENQETAEAVAADEQAAGTEGAEVAAADEQAAGTEGAEAVAADESLTGTEGAAESDEQKTLDETEAGSEFSSTEEEGPELTLIMEDTAIDEFTLTGLKVMYGDQAIHPDDEKLTIEASDSEMVKIIRKDDSWVLSAWKPGTVYIRAYYEDKKAEKELIINNVAPRLSLSADTVIAGETITAGLVIGDTVVFATADGVSGFCSDTDILDIESVGQDFTLKGISPGNADFTLDYLGETVTQTVEVLDRGEAYLSKAREYEEQGDDSKAFDNYRIAAESGNAEAQVELGEMYTDGEVVEENLQEAAYWYQKAADQDNAIALKNLGAFYYYGNGVSEDVEKGIALIQKAVDLGDPGAMVSLGRIYYYGRGIEKDDTLAWKYLQKAADLDYRDAFADLAYFYRNGIGTQQDLEKASELEERAFETALEGAGNGDSVCMYDVGIAYETGQGTTKNLELAFEYFLMGADKKHSSCMGKVSQYYFEGKGNVQEDGDKAFEYAKASADRDNHFGWYMLGLCYEYGKGTEKDIAKAIECYTVSSDYGNADAKERLDQLMSTK